MFSRLVAPQQERALRGLRRECRVDGVTDEADELTRTAYDAVADVYANQLTATEPEQPIDLAMIDHFIRLLPEPRRVLDAGAGKIPSPQRHQPARTVRQAPRAVARR